MAISKIILNSVTQMDVTDTTAAAADVGQGKYFYTAAGVKTEGTASGGGGGGPTTIASGTYTGTGTDPSTAGTGFFVGTKMPQTDFWVRFKAQSDSVFPYDSNYKFGYGIVSVFSGLVHFDLSTAGDGKQFISDISYDINNGGTTTATNAGIILGIIETVRNANAANFTNPNQFRIDRRSDGFYVRLYNSGTTNIYQSGIKYDWEVVYFGTSPSTDIVEI